MSIELIFLVIYFVAMAGIGVWAAKRSSGDSEDFLLAGRGLGPAVTALRLQSSSMSGFMFLGAGSIGYTQGYFGLWYALGDLGGGVLNLSVLGRRMRKLSKILGSITSIEYLEHRYDSRWVRLIGAPIALFCMFFYVLAQFIAGGRGLAMVTGLDFGLSLGIAIGVIVLYTFLGGYLAVAYTDFVQALIMVIGMIWIFIGTLGAIGGFTAGNEKLAEIDPSLLSMFGKDYGYEGQWGVILGALLIFSVGYMGWPHVVVSHMAMRSPSVARRAAGYSTLFNFFFTSPPYLIGAFALVLLPELENPENAVFQMARTVLPSFAVGIVMAAIMAAIMSTADALLLQAGTIASHDLIAGYLRGHVSERGRVWVSRLTVLGLAVIGYLISVNEPPQVFEIVIFSTTVLGSAFAPSYVCAVWWKKANKYGCIASLLTGTGVAVFWELSKLAKTTGLDPMVTGIIASTLVMIVVSLATSKVAPLPERISLAIDETAKLGPIPRALLQEGDAALAAQAHIAAQSR